MDFWRAGRLFWWWRSSAFAFRICHNWWRGIFAKRLNVLLIFILSRLFENVRIITEAFDRAGFKGVCRSSYYLPLRHLVSGHFDRLCCGNILDKSARFGERVGSPKDTDSNERHSSGKLDHYRSIYCRPFIFG